MDAVCVGYGFVSSVELTRLAGCRHQYNPLLGGWVPVRDNDMETSISGIYAAGDCAGVAGSLVAKEEGSIAGLAAVRSLGMISRKEAESRARTHSQAHDTASAPADGSGHGFDAPARSL